MIVDNSSVDMTNVSLASKMIQRENIDLSRHFYMKNKAHNWRSLYGTEMGFPLCVDN